MQIADLYIRVSTDEQADKGYSQRYQEEVLRRYCEFHKIDVRNVYIEDHSAKTFNRPKFKLLLAALHKYKGGTLLLFTKWDRFSRNTSDSYSMLRTLSNIGVDAQAIEQPLDLTIPENKMMLAVYLAQPEVENDRRSLNTMGGMRRAMKEGRRMGLAPIGYKNIHSTDGKRKYIEQDPDRAVIMKWVFHTIAAGAFNTESIFKQALVKGLKSFRGKKCSKNNFWRAIKDPFYCGKIRIKAWRKEEASLVAGQHVPLISEALFYQVQDVLEGRKRKRGTAIIIDDRFPLRGFIQCEQCGRILTASSSRGKLGVYYDYYHCTGGCPVRFGAGKVHDGFSKELSKWKPHYAVKQLYKLVLQDLDSQSTKVMNRDLMIIQDEIAAIQERLKQNRKFLLQEKIMPDDYKSEKIECEDQLRRLEAQLEEYVLVKPDIVPMMDDALDLLESVNERYEKGSIEFKRDLVSSMFPEKLHFDGYRVRTPKVNEAATLIYNMGAAFSEIKMGQLKTISELSRVVTPTVQFSNTFLSDLKKLSRLYSLIKAA